ncbi:hypothetical protein TMEN_4501 [Trichophyton mentagrophytes]|uniref:DSBA-like thioredoxin domain-containing protein n=2 Tax=Trichophyton TaxID=5550 RepID=A0A059JGC2_TRIIM|nr:hypothetical protein TEQG_04415 [Trichophyton equinum CBS 127.97]EZF30275.1 hypothetical protein H101_06091 [Trichophyton interdigitale H6]KAG5217029.1 DSBA oxidoreductase [Trichophyton interdigitale]KDB26532.1 hypothetical protein H109_01672 [Trichophyton interdigitale MR816]GBF61978.1 hypothetical protein TMEN_4501 [Trichophyton mentagrophytes]
MAVITIHIVSDVICPWCYIGYRSLQRAIDLYQKTYPGGSKDEFEIVWKPYFIDKEPPAESEVMSERMLRRSKDPKMVEANQTRLKRIGAQFNIHFNFDGRMGSSRLAHQLLHLVYQEKGSEMQCKVSDQLFRYQFELGEDISKMDVVVDAAVEAGMDEDEVADWLVSDKGIAEMEQEEKEIRDTGKIEGVPHYIIGKQHLEGAADYTEHMEAFIAAHEAAAQCN